MSAFLNLAWRIPLANRNILIIILISWETLQYILRNTKMCPTREAPPPHPDFSSEIRQPIMLTYLLPLGRSSDLPLGLRLIVKWPLLSGYPKNVSFSSEPFSILSRDMWTWVSRRTQRPSRLRHPPEEHIFNPSLESQLRARGRNPSTGSFNRNYCWAWASKEPHPTPKIHFTNPADTHDTPS